MTLVFEPYEVPGQEDEDAGEPDAEESSEAVSDNEEQAASDDGDTDEAE